MMKFIAINIPVLFCRLVLAACSPQNTSPERHAIHAAYPLADAHFDPNTRLLLAATAKRSQPFLSRSTRLVKLAGQTDSPASRFNRLWLLSAIHNFYLAPG